MASRIATFDTIPLEHMSGRIHRQAAFLRPSGRAPGIMELPPLTDSSAIALNRTALPLEQLRKQAVREEQAAFARRWGISPN